MPGLGTLPHIDPDLATPLARSAEQVDVDLEVDVWRIPLRRNEATRERLTKLLSAEELARAARFRFDRHRERFIVAHGVLRTVLSAYVGSAPGTLRFGAADDGKPFLATRADCSLRCELRFNLSHSGDLALVAVSAGRELGVDVERIEPKRDLERLARRFFAPEERDALIRLPPDERDAGFFRYWTLKEAYLKAVGTGLGRALASFAVSAFHDGPPRLLRSDAGDADCWRFDCLEVGPGFAGAVAAETA